MIAKRYERVRKLGEGAHGEVWEARDRVSGRTVAVKLLRQIQGLSTARAQLEVAALRLRLPGVVELHDDGVENGQPYLVMELVEGARFPGTPVPCTWAQLADVAVALLETLAHVHEAAVVHRDLKPENVLVTRERQLRLLDFGVALRTDVTAERLTENIQLLGTPAYMAPEQVRGDADARSDLFAVGVMLYEALAGRLPFAGATLSEILRAHKQRPVPIAQAAPGVPEVVAQVIDRLLAYDPADRPRSATEVLHALRGEPSVEAPHFPWLGSQSMLQALVGAVKAGRSVDIVGPRGAGRTRCMLVVAQALGSGARVVWLTPSDEPFASLAPLLGPLAEEHAEASFEELRAIVTRDVRRALGDGVVVLADDAERIDSATASVLVESREHGVVVRALRKEARPLDPADAPRSRADEESVDFRSADHLETFTLEPLREKDLRSLFAGPDRLLHLREDAARVLRLRTAGLPAAVTEEVTRWVRLGIAHWSLSHLVITREAIEALESGLLLAAPSGEQDAELRGVPEAQLDLLAWLTLAWPHTSPALLSKATSLPRFRVEAHLAALAGAELVTRRPDGTFVPRRAISAAARWTEDRLRDAHDALARLLPAGATGRLAHLWLRGAKTDDERRAIAAEACVLSERLIDEGRLEPAMATLERGLRSVREVGPGASAEALRLLALWTEAAIESAKPTAIDRVLYEICRVDPLPDPLARMESLCRAAAGMREFTTRPLELIERVPRFEDARLERVRLSVRAQAARHLPDRPAEEAVLREIEQALPVGDADAGAVIANHWGRLRYQQGRFQEAARLHREAAENAKSPLVRTYSSFSAALASLDAFDFDDAARWATRALELARAQRHAYYEALAEWVLRTTAYRKGIAGEPDMQLLEAVVFLGVKHAEGVMAFNEAAACYRLEQTTPRTLLLARRAHAVMAAVGEPYTVLLIRCLLVLLGESLLPGEPETLFLDALSLQMPGIGLQALALLVRAGHPLPADVTVSKIRELAGAVPREHWDKRMDILSVDECLRVLT